MIRYFTRVRVLPLAIVGIAAALCLLLVYGYPWLFPLIEASSPEHYEKNVSDALAKGDVQRALKIARRAAKVCQFDPMMYTVYGRVLLECGKPDEAIDQLNEAFDLSRTTHDPGDRNTREAYYFAPARLTLGKYYFEQGKEADAIVNFELARAHAMLTDVKYDVFHAMLYQAYAEARLWARALEFGEPSDHELDSLDSQNLQLIARICEGKQDWTLAGRLAERLMTREGFASEAHYLQGRIALAAQLYDVSVDHLAEATSNGRTHAAFFLGMSLEASGRPAQAIEAFLRTAHGDIYLPFALAKAWTLLTQLPEQEQSTLDVTEQELLDRFDREIDGLHRPGGPVLYDEYRRLRPAGFVVTEPGFESGGRFPVVILWEDKQAPLIEPARISFLSSEPGDNSVAVRSIGRILQLQWVENLVNWEGVERAAPAADKAPGWIDTARDWFELRTGGAVRVQEDAGNSFLSIDKVTWFYSTPVPVKANVGYLMAGRVKGREDKAGLGWQFLDADERVIFEEDIASEDSSDEWTWQAGYVRSQLQWDFARVQLNVALRVGSVAFDDVILTEVAEPDSTCLEAIPKSP